MYPRQGKELTEAVEFWSCSELAEDLSVKRCEIGFLERLSRSKNAYLEDGIACYTSDARPLHSSSQLSQLSKAEASVTLIRNVVR
jgi:hypothetical protein